MLRNISFITLFGRGEGIEYCWFETGGIEYAQRAMHSYKDKALAILKEFEQNEANKALAELVIYTTERKK